MFNTQNIINIINIKRPSIFLKSKKLYTEKTKGSGECSDIKLNLRCVVLTVTHPCKNISGLLL